ncbi:16S rRNA (guanine(527)-N(7))-methyltransferase RsmG [Sulfitobacter noctilucae]|uniref:16S rRNA (guanine(527)-N(7))-methyltransferase RsmG n=1 Tax=Sulfitobacter noctilucae TaxID=1342302 RepID=UPI000468D708|nr:16S rRNA (guanine(527)-N(7))-methyltransferase RsmG [Sulfitobacter noctilucae]
MDPKINVSRETMQKLEAFASLVQKWTPKINLVSKHSLDDLWARHIWDSAQLLELAPQQGRWVDLGSGGGFPAIIIAILSPEKGHDHELIMVESDQRKSVFLRTALRELNLSGTVISERIEEIEPLGALILSARALADLTILLGYADHHLAEGGTALFPKGARWEKEAQVATDKWSFSSESFRSKSHPDAAVLKIKDIVRV